MRLLDTSTLVLHDFVGDDVPPYAILSHRWGKEAATFKEVQKQRARGLDGWSKIEAFCAVAKEMQINYAWVDTCCIDQRSTAELSEAINSMYRWYAKAKICIVYLFDVYSTGSPANKEGQAVTSDSSPSPDRVQRSLEEEVKNSQWFSRGWTLQELIAPLNLYFYNFSWQRIGDRGDFAESIYQRTGISVLVDIPLYNIDIPPYQYNGRPSKSVATLLSWASHRITTRGEDMAYCLLGLFRVTMPLLYGEGLYSAFRRLQLEIMKDSRDHSILAWGNEKPASFFRPLLAVLPSAFHGAGKLVTLLDHEDAIYSVSDKSLAIQIPVVKYWPDGKSGPVVFQAILNCQPEGLRHLSIFLLKRENNYCRFGPLGETPSIFKAAWTCSCNEPDERNRMVDIPWENAGTISIDWNEMPPMSFKSILHRACSDPLYMGPHKRELAEHSQSCEWYNYIPCLRGFEMYAYSESGVPSIWNGSTAILRRSSKPQDLEATEW